VVLTTSGGHYHLLPLVRPLPVLSGEEKSPQTIRSQWLRPTNIRIHDYLPHLFWELCGLLMGGEGGKLGIETRHDMSIIRGLLHAPLWRDAVMMMMMMAT